jgi:hypothetical protein
LAGLYVLPALLGLIWDTSQILQSILSKREKLIIPFGFVEIWLLALALVLTAPQIPAPTNEILAVIISLLFVPLLVWVCLPERQPKTSKRNVINVSRFLWASRILFVLSCVMEVSSAYVLYQTGYLAAQYNDLSLVCKILGCSLPNELLIIYRVVVVTSLGIAGGIVGVGLSWYAHGLIRGARGKHRLT